jgi:putative membrane protein
LTSARINSPTTRIQNSGKTSGVEERIAFLAWVRTGIAVIAFGFVIEKFNLFVLTMANASSLDAGRRLQLERLSGPLGRYDGFALILLGIALVVVSIMRLLTAPSILS